MWSGGNCGCCGGQGEAAWGLFIAGREREATVSEPMAQRHGDGVGPTPTPLAQGVGGRRVSLTRGGGKPVGPECHQQRER